MERWFLHIGISGGGAVHFFMRIFDRDAAKIPGPYPSGFDLFA
jgi:hypothetical protein